ncbi:MAG: alpha-galactosidase [Proteobacteria bacterium]|nr:alpha-galactosidase [Pseudomonadota bacterium]
MGIHFDEKKRLFHLYSNTTSYILKTTDDGDLIHLFWGEKLRDPDIEYTRRSSLRAFSPSTHESNVDLSYDTMPMEYPFSGTGDFRNSGFVIRYENGATATELKYKRHSISKGKAALKGLPATYTESVEEAESLLIEMEDHLTGIVVELQYAIFNKADAICRSVRLMNHSQQPVFIESAMSCSLDFPDSGFDMLQLSGSWTRERHVHKRRLQPGSQSIESKRGVSSHMQNPFIALMRPDATEFQGDCYGISLVYSGNFKAEAEVEQFGTTRVTMGINTFNFSWKLNPEESFQTPEAVLVFSSKGLNGLSSVYHQLYRERLCRGKFRDKTRPVLVNNWEATYFDFDETKLLDIAKVARDLGIELFVLDDGWFGKRDEDNSSLGDWFEDRRKLPEGLAGLGKKIRDLGLDLGLWVEPEMISKNSELYKEHPDWCLHIPERRKTESRNQLVLDLSRAEVCDFLIETLSKVFSSTNLSYVKWDMNRNLTEVFSVAYPADQQGEIAHRYVLGLYRVLETLVSNFPNILFESCSGGGGRFDPGMLYYMPQTWASDDTDAIERLKIQHGTSIVYPPITMGSHVSAVPNHQVHRTTPLLTRLHTSMCGNFGFELDLEQLEAREKELVIQHIEIYKDIRALIQFGDFYRLSSPFEDNLTAWMFVNKEQSEAALFYCQVLAQPHAPQQIIRLQGLNGNKDYKLLNYDSFFEAMGYKEIYGGDALMKAGFRITPLMGDFQSALLRFKG